MGSRRQVTTLVKQEVRMAFRNKALIFTFIIFPLFMWGLQGGVQFLVSDSLDTEGEEFYIANLDEGNSTVNMGDVLAQALDLATHTEGSLIYGAEINSTLSEGFGYDELVDMAENGRTPMVIIPENFTAVYNRYNPANGSVPFVEVITRPDDSFIASQLQNQLLIILRSQPFTEVTVQRSTGVRSTVISFEGESTEDFFTISFLAFLALIIAVQAPAGYVSTAFSGEREKRTMEALLALPMPRILVLTGKVLASLVLTGVFAIANIVGMLIFAELAKGQFEIGATEILAVTAVLVLTSFVATGVGISIASFAKDSKTATGYYQAVLLIPTMFVGFSTLFGGLPPLGPIYLIPFIHSIAVLEKAMFPKTLESSSITGDIFLDIILHIIYLLVFVIASFLIAARVFDREDILN